MLNLAYTAKQPSIGKLRPKPQLSCNTCRFRKVKCDRKLPCDTCINHGQAAECEYPNGGTISQRPTTEQINVISKLNHLENLMQSFMGEKDATGNSSHASNSKSAGGEDRNRRQSTNDLPNTFGRLSLDRSESSYVGSDHWAAIMDGIAELRYQIEGSDYASVITDRNPSICGEDGPEIFHGHGRYGSREEIIASLPPKEMVDSLVTTYFSEPDHIPIFLHQPTFLKEYQRYWLDIESAPIMWIGLLYCIMCFGARIQTAFESRLQGSQSDLAMPTSLLQVQEYREKTVQCLYAGQYIKPGRYTIETLLLYFMTEHHHHTDAQFGNWILMGQITRIAMRLGLHRDPSHTPEVTPFDGEMRRRLWTAIVQVDLTTSSQMGLPRMIREFYSDTQEPLNYLDQDLNDEVLQLPEPRPETFVTPILYIRTRNRLMSVFGKVSDMISSLKPQSLEAAWELDRELLEARSKIPAGLQLQESSALAAEGHAIFMHRISLDATFQHARCILHRPYLIPARTNNEFTASRKTCLDAALALLRHQQTLYLETTPGGTFESYRWRLSSFWNHGMLLAVTVLCLDLNKDYEDGLIDTTYWERNCRREVAEALRSAQRTLLESWSISADARKGATAIEVVLSKAGLGTQPNAGPNMMLGEPAQVYHNPNSPWTLEEFFGSSYTGLPSWDQPPVI